MAEGSVCLLSLLCWRLGDGRHHRVHVCRLLAAGQQDAGRGAHVHRDAREGVCAWFWGSMLQPLSAKGWGLFAKP